MIQTILVGIAFVVSTIALMLACYFLMRLVAGTDPEPQTKELASSVIFRISALHGLILALVFAQEIIEYQQLSYESAIETNAIADIYFDMDRYGADDKVKTQDALFTYVSTVIAEEWAALGDTGRASASAWKLWDIAYNQVLDLEAMTDREKSLRENMLEKIHKIAETRVQRQNHASNSISIMFWVAAIAGVIFMAFAYYSFSPRRYNLILICMFGAYTGLILFFIYAFSNPYSEPGAYQPSAHERLLEQLQEARQQTGR